MSKKKRLLTGLKPTGALHIGNYFGALKPFVTVSEEYESFLMVADLHSITTVKNSREMRDNIFNITRAYLASGVDPRETVLFQQSQILEHTELAWIFECLVTVPFLMQAHAYKDKIARGLEANAGLFNYPMLMAADILLYDADVVPVGEDQRQHIEYAREAANKFNRAYGALFTPPREMILKEVGVVPGIDGQKMSKSYKNTIPLFGTKEEVKKAVMRIVTDSEASRPENVYQIHLLVKPREELDPLYEENKGNYKFLKEALLSDLESMLDSLRERYHSYSDANIMAILHEGSNRARLIAQQKMEFVRSYIGTNL